MAWLSKDLAMLFRILRRLATSCSPAARQLGLLREHEDIARRHLRVRSAWASHLAESRQVVLDTAQRCSRRRRALVIGAGDCLDVSVAELAARSEERRVGKGCGRGRGAGGGK